MILQLRLGPAYSLWESQYVSLSSGGFGAHTNLMAREVCVSSGSTVMSGVDDVLPTVRHQHMGQDCVFSKALTSCYHPTGRVS